MLNFGAAGLVGLRDCSGSPCAVTRTSLQQLLGAWNFALSFRREALCCLDVAFIAARTLPTRRPTPPTRSLLDDLLLLCGIAPLMQADLKPSPRVEHFATDTSPSGAGVCVAPATEDLWRTLYNFAEEQGEHVRLSWGCSSASAGTHSTAGRMCCARHSRRLVCALQVLVPRARSHQRAGAHRADVAGETPGKRGCAKPKNLMLRRQPRRPRSILKKAALLEGRQLRTPAAGVRVSQCVSVKRGVHLGESCRPLSPVGGARSRCGQHKLLLFSSGQRRLPVR